MVDLQRVPPKEPKDMSHLRKGSETTLGWGAADRAVAEGPNNNARITSTAGKQPRAPEMAGTL